MTYSTTAENFDEVKHLLSDRPIRRAPCPCCGYDGTTDKERTAEAAKETAERMVAAFKGELPPKRKRRTIEEWRELVKRYPPPPEFFAGDMEKPQ